MKKKGNDEPEKKPLTYKEKQQQMMTLQSSLQSVILLYLSQHCDIIIGQPYKKCFKTQQFMKIKILQFDNDIIDVPSFVKNRCKECLAIENQKGTSEKTAKRRIQIIKRQQIMHLLMDILYLKGLLITIQIEEGDGIDGNICIFTSKKILMERNIVEKYGLIINTYLCELLKSGTEIVLRYNDIKKGLKDSSIDWSLFEYEK